MKLNAQRVTAVFTPDCNTGVGDHTIMVTATNKNGSRWARCVWHVDYPFTEAFTDPQESAILDPEGTIRTFTAVCYIPATIRFTLGRIAAGQVFTDAIGVSLPDDTIGNRHVVTVIASTDNDAVIDSCLWGLMVPLLPAPDPTGVLASGSCHDTSGSDTAPGLHVELTATLYGNGMMRYLKLESTYVPFGTCALMRVCICGEKKISVNSSQMTGGNGADYQELPLPCTQDQISNVSYIMVPVASKYYITLSEWAIWYCLESTDQNGINYSLSSPVTDSGSRMIVLMG